MTITIPPVRPGRPADPDLADRRRQMQAAVDAGAWKTAKPPLETTLAGLRCLRFKPDGKPRGYVLQLHGGGFRIGRPEFESLLAERWSIAAASKLSCRNIALPRKAHSPPG